MAFISDNCTFCELTDDLLAVCQLFHAEMTTLTTSLPIRFNVSRIYGEIHF